MRSNRGQQCGEYAAMVGLVAVAFIGMQKYISSRVAGALIDQSHKALGTMLPLDEGTGSSDSLDQVYEHSDGRNFVTQVVSTATGDHQVGFILAEPLGFTAVQKDALANGMSGAQILFQLPENVPELEGYEFSGDYFTDENGQTIGIFKKGKWEERKGYKVLDQPIFDPVRGTWFTGLDLNENGKYDAGTDLRTLGMLDGNVLILTTLERIKAHDETLAGLREFLGIEDLEIPDADQADIEDTTERLEQTLSGIDRVHLNEASPEELENINSAFDSLAPALGKARAVATRLDKEGRWDTRASILAQIPWSPSKGQRLLEDHGLAPIPWGRGFLSGHSTDRRSAEEGGHDIDEDTINGMVQATQAMERFVHPQKGEGVLDWAQKSSIYKHSGEIADHLAEVHAALEDWDVSPEEAKTAAQALDAAYALLVGDLDAALGLNQPPDDATESFGAMMLAEFSGRPDVDLFLQDQPQYDIDGDTLPDATASEDGQAQGFGYVVFTERDMFAEDGGGMTVSNVSSELATAMSRAKPHEVLKASPGLPPTELIFRFGGHPNDLEGTVAWFPIWEPGAPGGEMAQTGPVNPGHVTQPPAYNPNINPNNYDYHR